MKSKKPEITYDKDEDGGLLAVYFFEGPYGPATEAKEGDGVLFTAPNGEILGAIFDWVGLNDKQSLTSKSGDCVEVTTRNGKVTTRLAKKKRKAGTVAASRLASR